jgi:molybdopterin molybdotransferase
MPLRVNGVEIEHVIFKAPGINQEIDQLYANSTLVFESTIYVAKPTISGSFTFDNASKSPTITGYDEKSNTLFIGLPGHPAAALMVYEQILIGVWRSFTCLEKERTLTAKVNVNVPSAPGRMTFQLIKLGEGDIPEAIPVFARSGMISPVSCADGYFIMSENQEGVRPGDTVEVHLWK